MATTTTNYGLTKPSYGDNADIAVINSNMDKIDTKMKEIEDAGGGGASTWAEVANKPFETVGIGLSVDESGALNVTGGGSGGSSVSWNQIQTSGSKIAEVTIDGAKTDVYAPTGGSGGGGGSFTSEILYTATGTSRQDIELSKPYTDFDYLDITILKYDDGGYYDFMHTFIDCAQQEDVMNNNLFSGRTNSNIIDVLATANSFMRYKFTDATHITYPSAGGSDTIFQVKGIKFASESSARNKTSLYTNNTSTAQSIELSESYKNFDTIIFRMIRVADGVDNYQDEKCYDTDWIEQCQNSNGRFQFFGYTQWNTYRVTDETHFDLTNSASGVYVKEVIGVNF